MAGTAGAVETAIQASSELYVTTVTGDAASAGTTAYNVAHRPVFGGAYSGVARLVINGSTLCSGALISDTQILTAAHCVTNGSGVSVFSSGTAQFALTPGSNAYTGTFTSVSINSVLVNPGWNGQLLTVGNDLAILTLSAVAPAGAARYGIYTGSDDIGQTVTKLGWGDVGPGSTGATSTADWRMGLNQWDATFNQIESSRPANVLVYDFDDGTTVHDTLGVFGFSGLGLGSNEMMGAPGDSGGPSFINGQVAGVTSFRFTYGSTIGDVDNSLNSSFGEIGGDTRVSAYASWILSAVPESSTGISLAWGLLVVLAATRLARARRAG